MDRGRFMRMMEKLIFIMPLTSVKKSDSLWQVHV